MSENIYDEIEIEDMTYDATLEIYHYPCPCGDKFEIGIADLRDGEDIAVCSSCSLMIRVVFDVVRILVFIRSMHSRYFAPFLVFLPVQNYDYSLAQRSLLFGNINDWVLRSPR